MDAMEIAVVVSLIILAGVVGIVAGLFASAGAQERDIEMERKRADDWKKYGDIQRERANYWHDRVMQIESEVHQTKLNTF